MMGPAMFEIHSNKSVNRSDAQRVRRTTSGSNDSTNSNKMSTQSLNSISGGKLSQELSAVRETQRMKTSSPTRQRSTTTVPQTYRLKYVGSSTLDRTYTLPMLPWIIADVKRQSMGSDGYSAININLELSADTVRIVNRSDKQVLLLHSLNNISKFTQTAHDKTWFSYLFRDRPDSAFTIHIFQAPDENVVSELFNKMRESRKEILHKQMGQGLQKCKSGAGLETILTYSNQYEVMYVGSIRMSQKRAHPTVIDDAIDKFKDLENSKQSQSDLKSEETVPKSEVESTVSAQNIDSNETDIERQSETSPLEMTIALPTTRRFLVKVIEEGSDRSNAVSPIEPLPQSTVPSFRSSTNSLLLPTTLIPNTQSLDAETRVTLLKELRDYQRRTSQVIDSPDCVFATQCERKRSISGDSDSIQLQKQLSLPLGRTRVGSGGSLDMSRPRNIRYQNKTMLFLIGKLELCLISTDKHKVVLNKTFSNISHCSQGIKNADHFGVICREPSLNTAESYVIHVFMCRSEKLVSEIMHSLKQAFSNAYQTSKNRTQYICETCPMHWYHRLCCDIEGQSPDRTQAIILNRLEAIPLRDREECFHKCNGIKVNSVHEQNELFMSGLKVICESKQKKHSHSGPQEKRSLEKRLSVNTLDNLKEKARTSISNTFDSFFKTPVVKSTHNTHNASLMRKRSETLDISFLSRFKRLSRNESSESLISSPSYSQKSAPIDDLSEEIQQRPRSNTLSEIKDICKDSDEKMFNRSESLAVHQKKPLLNIFMKVGSQTKLNVSTPEDSKQKNNCNKNHPKSPPSGSWRQSIFNRIHLSSNNSSANSGHKNTKLDQISDNEKNSRNKSIEMNELPKKKTKQELRELWKSAIKQQMILIKMDKQNKRIQDDQSSTYDKRMKLDYDEIPNFTDGTQLWDATKTWDTLIEKGKSQHSNITYNQLLEAIQLGVPRHKKGDVWLFLAEQHKLMRDKRCESSEEDTPYRQLLGQLTTQQHAILVDLGRTFPKVAFYSQALGSGQLSLYNLLKAYSLYDTEVEYCQGLSFVAGILLLHMNEDEAFQMIKHILVDRGLRKQYKPDMDALQMQLYQLTRLLYDHNYSIYEHFEYHDIAPTLYAAPWFLTLFASQFPISFVTRLFDILFVMGIEAIFRVSLILLDLNCEAILQCQTFESIMEFLKEDLPAMELSQMERVFEKVFDLDIKHQLDAYEVEYRVIQEELIYVSKANNSSNSSLNSKISESELMVDNQSLKQEVQDLTQQIHVYQTKCSQLQTQSDTYFSSIKRMEQRLRACEDERDALMNSVTALQRRNEKLEIFTKSDPNIKELLEKQEKSRSDRNSISLTPVLSISRPEYHSNHDYENDVIFDDDIDINSDSDDKEFHKLNRTHSDASNLSI